MKHPKLMAAFAAIALMVFRPGTAAAQNIPLNGPPNGPRAFNPFQAQFRQAWEIVLPDPVKLIEIGPATSDKKNHLLMLVGAKERSDMHRKLLVTHWDGFKFATDYSNEFLGNAVDVLLMGHLRTPPTPPKTAKGKTPPTPTRQIVTNAGVLEWSGQTFTRVFEAPADVRIAILLEKGLDQLLAGAGDKTTTYAVVENSVQTVSGQLTEDGGYVHFGVGTQDFPGSNALDMATGIRYVQSYWNARSKWMIGLVRGKPAGLTDYPNATTGDRLVVYVPKFGSRDKNFWATSSSDLEESWRSDPLPGRVLDVRVGDPKNDDKDGILVLTTEIPAPNSTTPPRCHLTFFSLAQGQGQGPLPFGR